MECNQVNQVWLLIFVVQLFQANTPHAAEKTQTQKVFISLLRLFLRVQRFNRIPRNVSTVDMDRCEPLCFFVKRNAILGKKWRKNDIFIIRRFPEKGVTPRIASKTGTNKHVTSCSWIGFHNFWTTDACGLHMPGGFHTWKISLVGRLARNEYIQVALLPLNTPKLLF